MTAAKEKALRDVETRKTGENGKNSKNRNEDLGTNLARVFYI